MHAWKWSPQTATSKYEQGRLWFQAFTTCMPWPHRRNMWCVNNGLGYMNNPRSRGTLQKFSFRNLFKFLLKHTSLGTLYRCMYTHILLLTKATNSIMKWLTTATYVENKTTSSKQKTCVHQQIDLKTTHSLRLQATLLLFSAYKRWLL